MIQQFADWLVYALPYGARQYYGLGRRNKLFVYDSVKILLLLFLISTLMGIVNAYFPIERLRHYLASHRLYGLQYLLASVFGAPFFARSYTLFLP